MGSDEPPAGVTALDHTADVGIEVEAPDFSGVFERSARGLSWLIHGAVTAEAPFVRREVDVTADDAPALLRAWLREILHLDERDGLAFVGARVHELSDRRLRAEVSLTRAAPDPVREIKGVTLHGLAVERSAGGWRGRVIFDV